VPLGLNALILQVRPAGDALYPSTLEPWSEVLSGEQGRAPGLAGEPPYDPLAFWVAEAHRRGLELHAWFNPYRARHSSAKSPLAAPHLACASRRWSSLWRPAVDGPRRARAAAAHTLAVVADVLRRYDVDGVHIDDYFYPYPVQAGGVDLPFPTTRPTPATGWAAARWRATTGGARNVDGLVQALPHGAQHQAAGACGRQPLRRGPARPPPAGHQRLQPVRQALCRRGALA
jgi:uncharacterized lipoprotein YddW (UPF0748 family)